MGNDTWCRGDRVWPVLSIEDAELLHLFILYIFMKKL